MSYDGYIAEDGNIDNFILIMERRKDTESLIQCSIDVEYLKGLRRGVLDCREMNNIDKRYFYDLIDSKIERLIC